MSPIHLNYLSKVATAQNSTGDRRDECPFSKTISRCISVTGVGQRAGIFSATTELIENYNQSDEVTLEI